MLVAKICYALCLVAQLYRTVCDPVDRSPSGSSVYGNSPGKNTGVSCHALLQGIFPTQGVSPGLPTMRKNQPSLSLGRSVTSRGNRSGALGEQTADRSKGCAGVKVSGLGRGQGRERAWIDSKCSRKPLEAFKQATVRL